MSDFSYIFALNSHCVKNEPSNLDADKIVAEYQSKRPIYERFVFELENFLRRKLKESDIHDAIIKGRTKEIESFREKILRPGKQYSDPLQQLTDLAGIRVIVCYVDQITEIQKIIEENFDIDHANSIDKSKSLAPNAFGYLSVHHIVTAKKQMLKTPTWQEFAQVRAEIQIRTSLQDSWATVSHALQYKVEADIPDSLKRKLFRLAGLFELADEQFMSLRVQSNEYRERLRKGNIEKDTDHGIDFISITEFLQKSTIVHEVLGIAKTMVNFHIDPTLIDHYGRFDVSLVTQECSRLGIDSVDKLNKLLVESSSDNEEYIRLIGQGRVMRTTTAFLLFLLIVKACRKEFDPKILSERYGWDYLMAVKIVSAANHEFKKRDK